MQRLHRESPDRPFPERELTWLGPIDTAATGRGLPLATETVAAGFPSPADDYVEASIDLNTALIPRPTSTFLMRVEGDAMRGAGIHHGDLLVVDRSVSARPGCTVVAVHEGRFLLRHLRGDRPPWQLVASDPAIPPVTLQDSDDPLIWGVVIHAVHHLLPRRRQPGTITRTPGTAAMPPAGPWGETQPP
jgi:DNA polymerase V